MQREANPFPAPCIRHAGACNLWDAAAVTAWEDREHARSSIDCEHGGAF